MGELSLVQRAGDAYRCRPGQGELRAGCHVHRRAVREDRLGIRRQVPGGAVADGHEQDQCGKPDRAQLQPVLEALDERDALHAPHGDVGAHHHAKGRVSRGEVNCCLAGSVAIANQHAHILRSIVSDGQVWLAVAVEITHRHGNRLVSGVVGDRCLEGPVAIAQQYAHRQAAGVGDGQVRLAVPIKIAHDHGLGV